MTKAQKNILAYLHTADVFLRKAMIEAGNAKLTLVVNDIRESEWYLDDAIAHAEEKRIKVKKVVDKRKNICHNGSRKI